MPNDMTLTQSYEAQRDLLTGMEYRRGDDLVTQRSYTYDALGRPLTRDTHYPGKSITHSDIFEHNSRSELIAAQLDDASYTYAYDNIGNRESAQEAAEEATQYESNALNQYTSIGDFTPQFDAAGNQTLVKTATGIWRVAYNAENRPVRFESEDSNIVVDCAYDYMGRRATKKVTTNGAVTLHQRYIYRGYLQIAAHDLMRSATPAMWYILWDPTQATATRPLAIQKDNTWYTYGWDLTKNICEVYGTSGYIRTLYTCSPYGAVTEEGNVTQPFQWSSEFHDAELGLVYYNYRFFNTMHGNWLSSDPAHDGKNMYFYVSNAPINKFDNIGLWKESGNSLWQADSDMDTLQTLAKKIGANEDDWSCIWPACDCGIKQRYPKVKKDDVYDVSNLVDNGKEIAYGFDVYLMSSYQQIFPNMGFVDPQKAAQMLANDSGYGATPIGNAVFAGHGGNAGEFPLYVADAEPNSYKQYRMFTIQSLKELDKSPTYARARNKKGPVRCWFTRNATVRFSGCSTKEFGQPFASNFLRKSATVYVTNKTIGTSYRNNTARIHTDFYVDENGENKSRNRYEYYSAPVWEIVHGSL